MNTLHEFIAEPMIAYFSMEIGVKNDIPTYSGGLGILAGDTIKSAADLNLPLVAVTLITRKGYFTQEIDATGEEAGDTGSLFMTLHRRQGPDRRQRSLYPGMALYGREPHRRQSSHTLP
jgi:hypothetical protein